MKLPSHFYAIVDPLAGHDPVELARTMLEAGARIMQLRLKDAAARDFLAAARAIPRYAASAARFSSSTIASTSRCCRRPTGSISARTIFRSKRAAS